MCIVRGSEHAHVATCHPALSIATECAENVLTEYLKLQ